MSVSTSGNRKKTLHSLKYPDIPTGKCDWSSVYQAWGIGLELMDIKGRAIGRAKWRREQCKEVGTVGTQGLAAALKSGNLSNKVVPSLDRN